VAVVTTDLDATLRFYGDVLGMDVGEFMNLDARGGAARHCFVRTGGTESWGLHFFEARDARDTDDTRSGFGFDSVGPHHMAFGLPDEAAGIALRQRLEQNGIEATPIGDAGPVRNTLFLDNNGLLLEAAWPIA